jgi:hypothetical protein
MYWVRRGVEGTEPSRKKNIFKSSEATLKDKRVVEQTQEVPRPCRTLFWEGRNPSSFSEVHRARQLVI